MIKLNKGNVSRRKFLKTSGAASAAAVVGPWVISPKALAASGEVNVLMWSDYLPPDYLAEFTAETGITVNYTGIGSNEEIINKMKATKGKGIDICSPTNVRSGQWVELELLQPWDYSRVPNLGNVNPAMLKVGDNEWNFGGAGSHWLPQIWGTEAISCAPTFTHLLVASRVTAIFGTGLLKETPWFDRIPECSEQVFTWRRSVSWMQAMFGELIKAKKRCVQSGRKSLISVLPIKIRSNCFGMMPIRRRTDF